MKPVSRKTLIEAIQCALARYEQTHEQAHRLDPMRALIAAFTPRERDVFDQVVRGKLNKQIAYELGISERTVKTHRHAAMQKLEVQSLAEAVVIAERLGVLATSTKSGRQLPESVHREEVSQSRIADTLPP